MLSKKNDWPVQFAASLRPARSTNSWPTLICATNSKLENTNPSCDDDVLCGNLWKERNWRVFDQKLKTPMEVMQEIKHEADTRKLPARARVIIVLIYAFFFQSMRT